MARPFVSELHLGPLVLRGELETISDEVKVFVNGLPVWFMVGTDEWIALEALSAAPPELGLAMPLYVSAQRLADSQLETGPSETGIYVRAFEPTTERWGSYDIGVLELESLIRWLRAPERAGVNRWAEGILARMLGWSADAVGEHMDSEPR